MVGFTQFFGKSTRSSPSPVGIFMAVLECQQLRFAYPETNANALSGIDLLFPRGTFTALLGPNGAGKSTLLKCLGGFLVPDKGEVLVDGRSLRRLPPRERSRSLAYLPQSVHFAFPLTVRECVEMGRFPYSGWLGTLNKEDRSACDQALELCDASHLSDRPLDSLSGGERQRVLLASALAQSPRVLLLDEPTLSLDLPHQEGFFKVVKELHRRGGTTVVVATHELNLASRNAERLVLLSKGRVDSDGTPKKVLTPKNIQKVFGLRVQNLRGPNKTSLLVPTPGRKGKL
jgi:iron complex transport system ATP-binding protein